MAEMKLGSRDEYDLFTNDEVLKLAVGSVQSIDSNH